jgi:hypothetical protein
VAYNHHVIDDVAIARSSLAAVQVLICSTKSMNPLLSLVSVFSEIIQNNPCYMHAVIAQLGERKTEDLEAQCSIHCHGIYFTRFIYFLLSTANDFSTGPLDGTLMMTLVFVSVYFICACE